MFFSGCSSISTDSSIPKTEKIPFQIPFSINGFTYDYNTKDTLTYTFKKVNIDLLQKTAAERYPEVFGRNTSADAVSIMVNVRHVKTENCDLVWNVATGTLGMASMFLIPVYQHQDICFILSLELQNRWGRRILAAENQFYLSEKTLMSFAPWVMLFSAGDGAYQRQGALGDWESHEKAVYVSQAIADGIVNTLVLNQRQIKQKILFSEVEKRWAVLVGLESDQALFAADDARVWRKWMADNGWPEERVKAMTGKNVLRNDLEGVFENFLGNATANDLIVLMWSGDVYADPARPDDVYLTCRDTDPKAPWTGYRLADLFKALKENRASKVVLLLDICNGSGKKLLTRECLKKLGPLPDWMLIVNESAKRGDDRSSGVLARLLPEGLDGKADSDGDRLVTLKELAVWLKSGSVDYGDLMVWMPAESSKLPEFPLSNR